MESGFEKAPLPETATELELDEKIIEDIVNGKFAEEFDPEESEIYGDIHLRYGSKVLRVSFYDKESKAGTVVLKQEGFEHKENETSYLYAAAKAIMQQRANEDKKDVRYEFMTGNKNMFRWAESKGKEIFNWDDYTYDDTKVSPYHVFVKIFHPEKVENSNE